MCDSESDQLGNTSEEEISDNARPVVGRVIGNAIDLPEHLQALHTSSSEALSEEQQAALIELLLK